MSIASVLTRLSTAKETLANKIVSLGGSISEGDGFEDFSSAMDTIPLGSSATLVSKTITENGVYDPNDDSADGYSSVNVSVSGSGDLRGLIERTASSLTIPNGTTVIGGYICMDMAQLVSITIPNTVTTIENYAFNNCSSLPSVVLPNGITYIGDRAFASCAELVSLNIPNDLTLIRDYVFKDCSKLAISSLPSGITSIGSYAFQNCTSLAISQAPSSLQTINSYAFDGCTSLDIALENATYLQQINAYAFRNCTNLKLTTITRVKTIGSNAFEGCTSLTNLTINHREAVSSDYIRIGSNAFKNCSNLSVISFPNVTQVPSLSNINAFTGLPADYEIRVPSNLLTSWKAATNWKHADVIDHIVAITEE